MSELRQEAEAIAEQFSDHLDVGADEVEERLENLVNEYRVPSTRRVGASPTATSKTPGWSATSSAAAGANRSLSTRSTRTSSGSTCALSWSTCGEPRSDSISQVGLLGDESGTIKFVAFETSDLPELTEGQAYELSNVVTDEYEGSYSVKLNRTTQITEIDEEIEVGDNADTVEGALVDIQSGSGLIKRCPEEDCTRVLQNGRCSEHGQVEGEFDLRIKGVLDDGETVTEVIFDREATEELTGMGLEEAKDMAMDALDTTVVAEEMGDDVLGRYYRVTGPTFGRYVLVDEMEDPVRSTLKTR